MAIDKISVLKRLDFIINYYEALKEFESISLEFYLQDFKTQLMIERLFELIIQASLDINEHILKTMFNCSVKTNKESFLKMGELQVIDHNLALELSKSAGMRNILAHDYLEIDQEIVFISIDKALKQYPLYILQIQQYLDSLESENN